MNILTMAFPARIFRKTIREVVKCANFDKERFAEEIQSHIEDREKGIYFHAGVPNIPRAGKQAVM